MKKWIRWIFLALVLLVLTGTFLFRMVTLQDKPMTLWIASSGVVPLVLKIWILLPEILAIVAGLMLAFLLVKPRWPMVPALLLTLYFVFVRIFSHALILDAFNSVRLFDFFLYPLIGLYIGAALKYCLLVKKDFDLFWKSLLLYLVWAGFISLPGPSYYPPGTLLQTAGFILLWVLYPLIVVSALVLPFNTFRTIFKRKSFSYNE